MTPRRPPHLAPKGRGNNSMVGKQEMSEDVYGMVLQRLRAYSTDSCHPIHGKVATHSRRSLPPSERSDAGWHILSLNWLFLSTGPAVCAWILLVMEFYT